jgi:hypothetical protein
MSNYISASLTTTNKNDIKSHAEAIKLICTFLVNLTPKDRQKIFKMGLKSEGFVTGALSALKSNPAAVPSTFSLSEFEKDFQLYKDLRDVLYQLLPLVEGVEDTLLLLGGELMKQSRLGYKLIRTAARGDAALDTVAKELGKRFQRAPRIQPTVHTLQPGQSVTLQGVVSQRLFKTLNRSAVSLYRGEAKTGEPKTIEGNSKILVPTGWNTVTVVNHDASVQAIFSILQK